MHVGMELGELCASIPNMRRGKFTSWFVVLAAAAYLSGCAGIRMQIPRMTPITKASMQERFKQGIPGSLNVPASDRRKLAFQAANSVHGAAIRMCNRVFGPEHNCMLRLSRYRLTVMPNSLVVNAHIDTNNHITVYGGLIRSVGSEGELAAVLAHEYAHGLMNHPRRKMQNIAIGTLAGMAAGAVVGAAAGDDSRDTTEGMRVGAEYGQLAGIRAYSQAMENEADHLGLFILKEAGYDPKAASHFHMRMLNERKFVRNRKRNPTTLYIRTHPGSKERVQKLIGGEGMIKNGHVRPIWKK